MKKVSIMVPCYNEEENVVAISLAIKAEMEKLPQYDYEILFIDNCSQDRTRELIRGICKSDPKVKAIFNAKNFGQFNSPYYALCQTTGDCTISICCDFQDPVELIPVFLEEWEKGSKIVSGVKSSSKESGFMYFLRSIYYKTVKKLSKVEQIEHFTGFGLYDKSFIDVLRELGDPTPFIRGIVAELGPKVKRIEYEQPNRRAGKSHNNFFSLYDAAMLSFTSYTKFGPRFASFLGIIMCILSFLVGVAGIFIHFFSAIKLYYTVSFPILLAIALVGGIQLFFIGFIGEYIMAINARVMNRPLVVEEERINFD